MHVMGRIGFMGLGIALVSCLGGAPVFAADKPIEDGSKIIITSPKAGDKVSDSFELKYELTKGSQAAHAHVFVDNEYQKGFQGTFKGLSRGTHQITVTGATKDHALVAASQTITVEVQ
ncbi:MAG: hypothetical protein CAF43_013955 [Nitrospira sp. CG24C]|jgi:hypothetical protein|nr:MAG: hypothetical protein CAF43_013955 [Nitrospira sp. CG24C]